MQVFIVITVFVDQKRKHTFQCSSKSVAKGARAWQALKRMPGTLG